MDTNSHLGCLDSLDGPALCVGSERAGLSKAPCTYSELQQFFHPLTQDSPNEQSILLFSARMFWEAIMNGLPSE